MVLLEAHTRIMKYLFAVDIMGVAECAVFIVIRWSVWRCRLQLQCPAVLQLAVIKTYEIISWGAAVVITHMWAKVTTTTTTTPPTMQPASAFSSHLLHLSNSVDRRNISLYFCSAVCRCSPFASFIAMFVSYDTTEVCINHLETTSNCHLLALVQHSSAHCHFIRIVGSE